MADSIINCANPFEADVILMAANYDRTSSFGKGSDKGPGAIVKHLNEQIELFERNTRTEPSKMCRICYHDIGDLNGLSPEEMVDAVAKEFEKFYNKKKFIITLGGEHSISNGMFKVLAPNASEITVFQIDAHADLRNDDSDYSDTPYGKYAHSCVMRRACELGLNTVQVGIRAYSKAEYDYIMQKGLTVFEWKRTVPLIDAVVDAVKTNNVYLTIDVDGIDPCHMPATGTPVQGGLEWHYTLALLETLFRKKNVVAADIVEVAPRPNDSLTEYGAAQLCHNLIAYKIANAKH